MKIGNQQQKKKDKLPIDRMYKDGIGLYVYKTTTITRRVIITIIAYMNVFVYKFVRVCVNNYVLYLSTCSFSRIYEYESDYNSTTKTTHT